MAVTSALNLLLQAAQVPPSAESAGFGAMWVDWNALGRQSSAAERAPPPVQKRDRADAASLGQRVGEVVASGDCAIGERLRSEEHTSELQSLMRISYAVFCLKTKK